MRIGHGYDVHRLCGGRRLVIGGVEIPYRLGLFGHSDADVLLHAVCDALLGAAALGDIGKLFPDTDEKYMDADCMVLRRNVASRLSQAGYHVVNVDSTVVAQTPKLAPHIQKMRQNIAFALGINISEVSVKATTEEGLGVSGQKQAIAAHAVCLIEKKQLR